MIFRRAYDQTKIQMESRAYENQNPHWWAIKAAHQSPNYIELVY